MFFHSNEVLLKVFAIIFEYHLNALCRCRYGTVLHTAAWYGHLDVYKLISKYVKNKNPASGVDGATPLHFAAQQGQLNMCKYLIEKAWVDISFGN